MTGTRQLLIVLKTLHIFNYSSQRRANVTIIVCGFTNPFFSSHFIIVDKHLGERPVLAG